MKRFYSSVKHDPRNLTAALYALAWVGLLFTGVVFYIDEYKRCLACKSLAPLKKLYIPVSCEASEENDHHVVHIDCPLYKLHTFYPPPEFKKNLKPFQGVFFDMRVEMYQWEWNPDWLHFGFRGRWSSNLLDSKNYPFFLRHTHTNPDFFPHIAGVGRQFASTVSAGDFILSRRHLVHFRMKRQLPLINDGIYIRSREHPCSSVSYRNTQVYQNALFTGNPLSPQIGDLRITFWGSTATHVSAIAVQRYHKSSYYGFLEHYAELEPLTNYSHVGLDDEDNEAGHSSFEDIEFRCPPLLNLGDHTPEELFEQSIENRTNSNRLGRLFSFSALIVFFTLVSTLTALSLQHRHDYEGSNGVVVTCGCFFFSWGCILLTLIPFRIFCDVFFTPSSLLLSGLFLFLIATIVWKLKNSFNMFWDPICLFLRRQGQEDNNTLSGQPSLISRNNQQHIYQPV